MKVGITASSTRVTQRQLEQLREELQRLGATELHHGDCVEGDAKAHGVARGLDLKVVVHPPIKLHARAFCEGDETRKPREYLARNRCIVDEVDYLIALPDGPERLRSGTWSTVRYAWRQQRIRERLGVKIIMPLGTIYGDRR